MTKSKTNSQGLNAADPTADGRKSTQIDSKHERRSDNRSKNIETDSGNSKFTGRLNYECALKNIALSDNGEDNQLKKFTVGLQALANKLKLLRVCKSIEDMIKLKETNFVKKKLDASSYTKTKSDGTVEVDEVKKREVKSKWNQINTRKLDLRDIKVRRREGNVMERHAFPIR